MIIALEQGNDMARADGTGTVRALGAVLIAFAIAFNLPYSWLAVHFDYPDILRRPAGIVLGRFAEGGAPLILAWGGFALAALLFAPVAVAVSVVTRRPGHAAAAVAALGVGAGVVQAIGLSRWVYVVPGLAALWTAGDAAQRMLAETVFFALHQFAGVGIGEAIGQTLTAAWLIGVALGQRGHPRFGALPAVLGMVGGVVLLLGLAEGLSTVIRFDPGPLKLSAAVGYLVLTVWLIWTGVLCILRPASEADPA
jgi:hypothetical protein